MAIETQTVNPTAQQPISNGGVITPEAWRAMSAEQKAAYPIEVQNLMNQQEALLQNGIPAGTIPIQPAAIPGLKPNQDVVVPPSPAQMGQQAPAQPMTLKERKAVRSSVLEGAGVKREWYAFWETNPFDAHDASAMIAGFVLAGFIAIVIGTGIYLIRKN